MKFSSQEEYGLRFLIRIGKFYHVEKSFTIPEISTAEGVSEHTVAKILRQLRLGGFLESVRGQQGGYTLTRSPDNIVIADVFDILGGRLFDDEFCGTHGGENLICNNTIDCSVRSLWKAIQDSIDKVSKNLTLKDLLSTEDNVYQKTSEFN
ncbi:MAG: Rrf2 family transcriptional regulator [Melioribacteraceae bacterium]|nr:Rrf2 family transcriptional regulator [Melioribacteraceae bacterium]